MSKQQTEISLGGGTNLLMTTSKVVSYNEILTLITPNDGTIQLDVKIQADFDTVPEKYHEIFLNMLSAKYMKVVSFGNNPFSQYLLTPKKRWYQFWKH